MRVLLSAIMLLMPGYRSSCRVLLKTNGTDYTNATKATPAATAAKMDEMGAAPMGESSDEAAFASAVPVAPLVGVLAGTICSVVWCGAEWGSVFRSGLSIFCLVPLTCKLLGSGKSGEVAAVGVPFAAKLEYKLLRGVP